MPDCAGKSVAGDETSGARDFGEIGQLQGAVKPAVGEYYGGGVFLSAPKAAIGRFDMGANRLQDFIDGEFGIVAFGENSSDGVGEAGAMFCFHPLGDIGLDTDEVGDFAVIVAKCLDFKAYPEPFARAAIIYQLAAKWFAIRDLGAHECDDGGVGFSSLKNCSGFLSANLIEVVAGSTNEASVHPIDPSLSVGDYDGVFGQRRDAGQ